jgi:predicted type IV restriction endonuclease
VTTVLMRYRVNQGLHVVVVEDGGMFIVAEDNEGPRESWRVHVATSSRGRAENAADRLARQLRGTPVTPAQCIAMDGRHG